MTELRIVELMDLENYMANEIKADIDVIEMPYPLAVCGTNNKGAIRAASLRSWAIELAKQDAEALAAVTGNVARVIDLRTGSIVYEVA